RPKRGAQGRRVRPSRPRRRTHRPSRADGRLDARRSGRAGGTGPWGGSELARPGSGMDLITTLGRTLGFSFAAGVNLYATVAILGLASRFEWVRLPEQYQAFNNDWLIGAAILMYLLEFFADKVPYVDPLWDIVHTAIRPGGGARSGGTR